MTLSGFWRPVIFVAAAVPITLLANAGRIIATGLIGQGLGVEYADGFFHGLAGWLIFVTALLCLYPVYVAIRRTYRRPSSNGELI
jgi:exosortase/archaeosortase family protein